MAGPGASRLREERRPLPDERAHGGRGPGPVHDRTAGIPPRVSPASAGSRRRRTVRLRRRTLGGPGRRSIVPRLRRRSAGVPHVRPGIRSWTRSRRQSARAREKGILHTATLDDFDVSRYPITVKESVPICGHFRSHDEVASPIISCPWKRLREPQGTRSGPCRDSNRGRGAGTR